MADTSEDRLRKPSFLQVRDALAQRIARGEWAPGAALPNEIALAHELGVSADTISKALDILESERILSRRQGCGTFVNEQASGELAFRSHNVRAASGEWVSSTFRDVEIMMGPADDRERERLTLDQSPNVFRIRRLRLFEGRPHMLEQSCLPEALFPNLQERASAPYQLRDIAAAYGLVPARAQERVSTIVADRRVAERLEIAEGTAILLLDRVVHSSEGTPVEWRLAQCHLRDGPCRADMR